MLKVNVMSKFRLGSEHHLPKLGRAIGKMINRIKSAEKPEGTEITEKSSSSSLTAPAKIYLKALPLRNPEDVDVVKREINAGNILILRISPLAKKSIDDVKRVVNELCEFTESVGGDIARLGEERVVVTPSSVRIWREKTAAPGGEAPTAA